MPTLISHGAVVADDWVLIDEVAGGSVNARSIVPAAYALAHADTLFEANKQIGVWLAGDAEPEDLRPILDRIALIAIRFTSLNDGRGLSIAVLLRTRLEYRGELRAIGAVHEDVLHYMRRCGFDSYQLPDGRDAAVAIAALGPYSEYYQGSVVEPQPAFRRITRGTRAR